MSELKVKTKTQRDLIISVLRSRFHDIVEDQTIFPTAIMDIAINVGSLRSACFKNKNLTISSDTKNFKPVELESVKNDVIPEMILQFNFDSKKNGISVSSESGMFKLKFSDGTYLFFAQRTVGMGRNQSIETYGVADKKTINNYYRYLNKEAKINSKPKVGLYKISTKSTPTGEKLDYQPLKIKTAGKEVFHQNKLLIEEDVRQFFDNIELYTRFNQPGSRRLLLVGEPGGGKTSAAHELAIKYSQNMCVVIATDLKSLMMHTFNISKSNMPTLAILEDAESTIPWGNSDILNYLDGVNQPKTEKGCYTILTTNFPQRIEPRVLKRPGRIDRIVKFGVLDQINSLRCIRHYFQDILFNVKKDDDKVIEEILKQTYEQIVSTDSETGMTGAQIKNLSEASISYAVSNKIDKITVDVLVKVKDQLTKDLKDVYEMAEDEGMSHSKSTPIGFESESFKKKSFFNQDLDWDSIINPKTSDGKDDYAF